MKKLLLLLLATSCSLSYSQELFNPFYNNFYFGDNVEMKTDNMLQMTSTTLGVNQRFDLSFLHQTTNKKWQFGGKYSRFDRISNYAEILVRREIFNINNRRLFVSGSVSHYVPNSFDVYKYFSQSRLTGSINYAGKWIETGAKYDNEFYYLSPNGSKKNWINFESLGLYVGVTNKIKTAELKTRVSGTFRSDITPMLSQQLYLKSGFNFGYAIGFDRAFNANIGYRKNQFEVNATFGNHKQNGGSLFYENRTYLKAGIIFHL